MNDDINTLDFALVMRQFDALFQVDSEKRQQLKACSPPEWAGKRQWEDASHDCA